MALEKYHLYRLEQDTEILPFASTDDDLNEFLLDDAKKYLDDLLAVTYLFIDEQRQQTVAYFSLLNDRVTLDPEERSLWNRLNRRIANPKRKKSYPAVKVGRLAVSSQYAGEGVGKEILEYLSVLFTHRNRTGCRFLTVDAYQKATGFYQKCGFSYLSEKDKADPTRLMYFDLKTYSNR